MSRAAVAGAGVATGESPAAAGTMRAAVLRARGVMETRQVPIAHADRE